jgi:hypothetical protein
MPLQVEQFYSRATQGSCMAQGAHFPIDVPAYLETANGEYGDLVSRAARVQDVFRQERDNCVDHGDA